jgi:hypothetical protein
MKDMTLLGNSMMNQKVLTPEQIEEANKLAKEGLEKVTSSPSLSSLSSSLLSSSLLSSS